jgi:hypothetical protein
MYALAVYLSAHKTVGLLIYLINKKQIYMKTQTKKSFLFPNSRLELEKKFFKHNGESNAEKIK